MRSPTTPLSNPLPTTQNSKRMTTQRCSRTKLAAISTAALIRQPPAFERRSSTRQKCPPATFSLEKHALPLLHGPRSSRSLVSALVGSPENEPIHPPPCSEENHWSRRRVLKSRTPHQIPACRSFCRVAPAFHDEQCRYGRI